MGPNNQWKDNFRAVYEYVKKVGGIQGRILVSELIDRSSDEEEKEYTVPLESFRGLWCLMRSSVVIIHHGLGDCYWTGITNRNHLIVNVWHGIPLKGIGFTAPKAYSMKYLKRLKKRELQHYDLVISSSQVDRLAMATSFNLPYSRVCVTGLPRNDWLICKSQQLPRDLRKAEQDLKYRLNGRRLILYAPTFRKDGVGFYDFSIEEADILASFLRRNNAVMGLRCHINRRAQLPLVERPEFLDFSAHIYPETQTILRLTDVLITDYSSIWVDFLLTRRPVIGFVYDWNEYMEDRGLIYNYKWIFPGPLVHEFSAFISALEEALNSEISELAGWKYYNSLSMFHRYTDGHASERVVQEILKRRKNKKR